VQVVEKMGRRGQVKVRRLSEPRSGLEEYVKTRQLIAPWGERQTFLKDEERAAVRRGAAEAEPGARGEACSLIRGR